MHCGARHASRTPWNWSSSHFGRETAVFGPQRGNPAPGRRSGCHPLGKRPRKRQNGLAKSRSPKNTRKEPPEGATAPRPGALERLSMSQVSSKAPAVRCLQRRWPLGTTRARVLRRRVGIVVALACALGTIALGPAPAYAAPTVPTVTLKGKLILLADQTDPEVAALRTADNLLVPVNAVSLPGLKSGSAITLDVVPPASVRSVAAAHGTLTVRGPNGKTTSTPLDTTDLAAASDGTPEPAASDLGRATVASAVSTGQPLEVSAVVAATDPVQSYAPATRRLFVAVVTPMGWTPA